METSTQRPKLLVIVGPTASGKSDLAMKIAQESNGEIITADSRTIYRGMDIGTAKPTPKEQRQTAHWGLDLVQPGQLYSAAKFKKYAERKIKDIQSRGKLPILVGGTGLYVDGVLFDFEFRSPVDPKQRQALEKLSTEQLQRIIEEKGYQTPQNRQNRRHLIRTIERQGTTGTKKQPKKDILIIGLLPSGEELKQRIHDRVEVWFKHGLSKEVQELLNTYGDKWLSSAGIGYRAVAEYLEGRSTLEEAKSIFEKEHWQYARRQKTWFKRHKFIRWFDSPDKAYKEVSRLLNN